MISGSRQLKKGVFRTTEDGYILNFNNLIFRNPDFVQELRQKYKYTDHKCSYILQYFLQVAMVHPNERQDMVQAVLHMRSDDIINSGQYQGLHDLDPLRMFPNHYPGGVRGLPPRGLLLSDSPVLVALQDYKYKTGNSGFQLPGYKSNRYPLPIGITLHKIAGYFPNHCFYEFLDGFMQHEISPGAIVRHMHPDAIYKMKKYGIIKTADSMMTNRVRFRKEALVTKADPDDAGVGKVRSYINSGTKNFSIGQPIGPNTAMAPGGSNHADLATALRTLLSEREKSTKSSNHVKPQMPAQLPAQPIQVETEALSHQHVSQAAIINPTAALNGFPGRADPNAAQEKTSGGKSFPSKNCPLGYIKDQSFWNDHVEYQQL